MKLESNRCVKFSTNKSSSVTKSARRLWLKNKSMIGKWSTKLRKNLKLNANKRLNFNKK